ncbi:MAG: rRNA maturation RNase YbeY [Epsilonproteobacteria bacterium]|nr:MAG: rRNA maturation RNase YbeY [Campylobacterota bacterium]
MIDLDNQTKLNVDLNALEKIASKLSSQNLELLITDNQTIQALNATHRGKDSPTDVLSFPLESPFTEQSIFGLPLGSIVISASFVEEKAKYFAHSTQDELSLLLIHGILHLLGFDHENDNGEMRQKEEELIEMFALPKSLIVRNTEEY